MGGPGKRSRYNDPLGAGRSGDQIRVWEIFSSPVQTGPGAHTAAKWCQVSFSGAKWPESSVNHPLSSSTEVKERVELNFYFPFFYGPTYFPIYFVWW